MRKNTSDFSFRIFLVSTSCSSSVRMDLNSFMETWTWGGQGGESRSSRKVPPRYWVSRSKVSSGTIILMILKLEVTSM